MEQAILLALVIYALLHVLSAVALRGLPKWRITAYRGTMALMLVSVIILGDVAASATGI